MLELNQLTKSSNVIDFFLNLNKGRDDLEKNSSPSSEVPYPRERALPVVKIESVSVAVLA